MMGVFSPPKLPVRVTVQSGISKTPTHWQGSQILFSFSAYFFLLVYLSSQHKNIDI